MAKETQIQLRLSSQKKAVWKDVATRSGKSLTGWLEQLADEEAASFNAKEGDVEAAKVERHLLSSVAFPHSKRSFTPDFK